MDFIIALSRIWRKHNAIWMIVNRLTKSAHFLPIRMKMSLEALVNIYVYILCIVLVYILSCKHIQKTQGDNVYEWMHEHV